MEMFRGLQRISCDELGTLTSEAGDYGIPPMQMRIIRSGRLKAAVHERRLAACAARAYSLYRVEWVLDGKPYPPRDSLPLQYAVFLLLLLVLYPQGLSNLRQDLPWLKQDLHLQRPVFPSYHHQSRVTSPQNTHVPALACGSASGCVSAKLRDGEGFRISMRLPKFWLSEGWSAGRRFLSKANLSQRL